MCSEENPGKGQVGETDKRGENPRENGSMGEGGDEDGVVGIKLRVKDMTDAGSIESRISGEGVVAVDDHDERR
jgi:hypothetical protein